MGLVPPRLWCPSCGRRWPRVRWRWVGTTNKRRRMLYATCPPCHVGMALSREREMDLVPIADAEPAHGTTKQDIPGQAAMFGGDWEGYRDRRKRRTHRDLA